MKKIFVLVVLCCWLISACKADDIVQPTALVSKTPSFTPQPTFISQPSFTPTRLWKSFPTQTPYPTWTVTSTITQTGTPTPQPPLVAHTWTPERVLISLGGIGGDGGYRVVDLPGYILFSDGRLFTSEIEEENGVWVRRIRYAQLGRSGACKLLNTIDQNGFFDYDPATYQKPQSDGGPSTIITVNAWRRKSGTFYNLQHLRMSLEGPDLNSPALKNTADLLFWYEPPDLQEYEPDRVAVWIYENLKWKEDYKNLEREWTLKVPKLVDLHLMTGSAIDDWNEQYVIYQGDIAKNVYRYLADTDISGIFSEGDHQYTIFVQVLLPYQLPRRNSNISVFEDLPLSHPDMTCYPSDGILPIPTPPTP
ncbi:MAG: hypothetical protein ACOYZ6_11440 [Chloroflexota bacterium]